MDTAPRLPREGYVLGIAAFSFRSLPHWGRGTAQRRSGALANGVLETIFLALFHAARTLSGSLRSPPSPRGEGCVSGIPLPPSNLRPFGAPPSIGRRVYPREPLPLEGAAERSEAGLASFFAAKPPPLCLPKGKGVVSRKAASSFRSLPHWGRGTASAVDRVLSYIVDLRRIFPLIFHTASTLSGSLRSPPSPRGEGFVRRYSFSTYACICSDNARKAVFSFRCLPHWGRGTASAVDRVLS